MLSTNKSNFQHRVIPVLKRQNSQLLKSKRQPPQLPKLKSKIGNQRIECQDASASEQYGPQKDIETQGSTLEQEQAEQEEANEERTFRIDRDNFYSESMKQAYKSSDSVFSFEDDPLKLPLSGIKLSGLPASLDDEDTLSLGRLVEEVNNSKSKRRTILVGFLCNRCGGRSWRMVNPWAFSRGLVYVQCFYCESWHKLVDNISLVEEINFVHDDDVEETQDMIVQASAKIREQIEQKFQEDVETWVDEMEKKSEGSGEQSSEEGIEVEGNEEPIIVGQFVGEQTIPIEEEKD